jgi:hypothetical protein
MIHMIQELFGQTLTAGKTAETIIGLGNRFCAASSLLAVAAQKYLAQYELDREYFQARGETVSVPENQNHCSHDD